MASNKKVILGMSGGTDSSMSAILLKEQGYEVIGATLLTWPTEGEHPAFIEEARALAKKLNIPHYVIDIRKEFKEHVVDDFISSYLNGKTPSPCIKCNEHIKWRELLKLAKKENAHHISTGHYVKKVEREGFFHIQKGVDPKKDQSYFLWNLDQEILKSALFPLGEYTKDEIKNLAFEKGFPTLSTKKESMGVCFLQGTDYRNFIKNQLKDKSAITPGAIKTSANEIIGEHEGISFYTIGQKRGLNMQAPSNFCVQQINSAENTLIVGPREELYTTHTSTTNYQFYNPNLMKNGALSVFSRIRGLDNVPPASSTIEIKKKTLEIDFNEAVWAITPGQSIVFYDEDDVVLGGAIIK